MSTSSVAEIRERFSLQLEASIEADRALAEAVFGSGPAAWHKIDRNDWDGNLFDLEGIASAFSRQENTDDVVKAIQDVKSPGTVGDLAASAMQGDMLGSEERSFRSRHMTPVRRMAHAAARRKAHAAEKGLFRRGMLGTIEAMLAQTKGG